MSGIERSKGINSLIIIMVSLFVIFLIFAFFTISSLNTTGKVDSLLDEGAAEIAVVEVEGAIMDTTDIIKKLIIAEKDKTIKGIVLRINSPGGAVGPTQEVYEEIRRINEKKPIYASFGTVSASGGYYMGAACKKIFANAGTITGSIGVIFNFMNLKDLYKFAKLKPETIKSGKYKDSGNPARDMTAQERRLLQEMSDQVHRQFIEHVRVGRAEQLKKSKIPLEESAQGQIFTGSEALNRGLIDGIAGLWQVGRTLHKDLELKKKFGLRFIKIKKDVGLLDIMEGIEQSAKNITSQIQGKYIPMFLMPN